MNAVRSAVGSAVAASVAGPGASGGGEAGPTERVQNGNFSSATGWTGAAWSIAAGVATNNTAGQFLVNALVSTIKDGNDVAVSVTVIDNPAGVSWSLFLYNTGTLASQLALTDAGGTPGTYQGNVTASGEFDAIRIRALGDSGMVIDDVSAVA